MSSVLAAPPPAPSALDRLPGWVRQRLRERPPAAGPEAPLDDELYEEIGGERVGGRAMSGEAGIDAFEIGALLRDFVRPRGLGRVSVETVCVVQNRPRESRRPDVMFVSAERWPLTRRVPWPGEWVVVPDLAVEVLSPNDTAEALANKVFDYFGFGVREVWWVWPVLRLVMVFASPQQVTGFAGTQTIISNVLPALPLTAAECFPEPQDDGPAPAAGA